MFWDQSLLELFRKGGFAMWPLLACSILGIAIVLERSFYFARLRFAYGRFLAELKGLLQRKKRREAIAFCLKHANPVPHVAADYLKHVEDDAVREEVLKKTGSYALEQIESRLRVLAALTHIAPLLGLLGTVTGLVSAFHQIELRGGQVQPGDLAAGIWEALITTVFGLVIAIPCMAAYHGFEGTADRIARQMQLIISELNAFFGKTSHERFTPPHGGAGFTAEDPEQTETAMRAVE